MFLQSGPASIILMDHAFIMESPQFESWQITSIVKVLKWLFNILVKNREYREMKRGPPTEEMQTVVWKDCHNLDQLVPHWLKW